MNKLDHFENSSRFTYPQPSKKSIALTKFALTKFALTKFRERSWSLRKLIHTDHGRVGPIPSLHNCAQYSKMRDMNHDFESKVEPVALSAEAESALRQLARIILVHYQHRSRLPESDGTLRLCTEEK